MSNFFLRFGLHTGIKFCLRRGLALLLFLAFFSSCGSSKILMEVQPELTLENTKPEFHNQVSTSATYREGIPLEPGLYTYYYKNCDYEIMHLTDVLIKQFTDYTKHINFVKGLTWESSDHRIECSDNLGWTSFTGKDIFKLKDSHWTTSFGKDYSKSYVLYAIWHELFGHATMGLGHEQHNREGRPIMWSDNLYISFNKRFDWDRERVDQWINKHGSGYIKTKFDKNGIMLYWYPCEMTVDGYGCGQFNYTPSVMDWKTAFKLYGNSFLD